MNLDTLITIEEIRQLMARYARYADARRWADLAALFTPDGTFTSPSTCGTDASNRVEVFETGPTRRWYNPVYAKAHRKGGHFVPWENPGAFTDDVRATFRKLR